jgi:hypothetical protein
MPKPCLAVLDRVCVAACLLAISHAAFAAPVETNIQGITTIEAPPAGFDALHASAADLQRYRLPRRPDALRAPAAYAAWTHIVGGAKQFMPPLLRQTGIQHLPMKRVYGITPAVTPLANRNAINAYTKNWSGIADVGSVTSFGPNSIFVLYGEWVVPIAQQAFGACTGGTDYSAIWMGIDGYNTTSPDVFQGGTEADATCARGIRSSDYYIWFEWYPNGGYEITNIPVGAGDVVAGVLEAESSTSGVFYVINETTNVYTIVSLSSPAGSSLVGSSSEWIVELPSVNNAEGTLTNYIADFMVNTVAEQKNGSAILGGNGSASFPLYDLTMLDGNRNPISQPSMIGSVETSFEDEGSAK